MLCELKFIKKERPKDRKGSQPHLTLNSLLNVRAENKKQKNYNLKVI